MSDFAAFLEQASVRSSASKNLESVDDLTLYKKQAVEKEAQLEKQRCEKLASLREAVRFGRHLGRKPARKAARPGPGTQICGSPPLAFASLRLRNLYAPGQG